MASNTAPRFSIGSQVLTDLEGGSDLGFSSALQPNGRILVSGTATIGGSEAFAVARYNTDGSRDTTFHGDGRATSDHGGYDYSAGVAVMTDGRIVLAGVTSTFGTDMVVTRLNADGSPDTSFNGTGAVVSNFTGYDGVSSVLLQADGKILVGGGSRDTYESDSAMTVVRYNVNGSLDAGFGTGGRVVTPGSPATDWIAAMALQSDGKIVGAGFSTVDPVNGYNEMALVRYNADGSLDTAFGPGGILRQDYGPGFDEATGVAVQADGKIVAAGSHNVGALNFEFFVTRFNADGSTDVSFNAARPVFTGFGGASASAAAMRLQPDGKILVAGTADGDFALARYNVNGSLDTTFGGDGKVTYDFGSHESANALLVQADGRIVVSGYAVAGTLDFAVVRFNSDGSLDSTFGGPSTLDATVPYVVGSGLAVTLDPDVSVFDAQLSAQGHYAGASVMLRRQGGADATDQFIANGSLGGLIGGAPLVYDGVTMGTVTVNSGGTLLLTFDSAATQARVEGVLESVAYFNSGFPPTGTVVFDWTFSDGNGGAQGTGGPLSVMGSSAVAVTNPSILWSTLSNGQTVDFDPYTAILRFDDASISAADVRVREVGSSVTEISYAGKTVTLTIPESSLALSNVVFVNGSQMLVGNNDAAPGESNTNFLYGYTGNDQLRGLAGDDSLFGNEGNDFLDGGFGVDTLQGGIGNDTYVIADGIPINPLTALSVTGEPGAYIVQGSHLFTSAMGGFQLYPGDFNSDGRVDALSIYYSDANDWYNLSINTFQLGNLEPGIYLDAVRGPGPNQPGLDFSGNSRGASQVFGSFTIHESVFDYSSGTPSLVSFWIDFVQHGDYPTSPAITGTLWYNYATDFAPDTVIEQLNGGNDTVRAAINYTLTANVENLVLTGTALRGTGNGLANVITGNALNNTLDGAGGADTMAGGAGDDTYFVDSAGDVVQESANAGNDAVASSISYTLGANVENLTLTRSAAISGTGNGLDNTLGGNAAANVLRGMGGNDNYVIDALDTVIEQSDQGVDTVYAAFTYTLGANVENLTLWGAANINGIGNALANYLMGNGAANRLDGSAGADRMAGGAGNDIYVVDNAGDNILEGFSEGTDHVESSVTHTLRENVENLTLTGTAPIDGFGNTLANVLFGNGANNHLTGFDGNDTLDGRGGADAMSGGQGADNYYVDNSGDTVIEGVNEGIDTVRSAVTFTLGANVENLIFTGSVAADGTGNALHNVLTGNSARNTLTGGDGNDSMDGLGDADRMVGGRGSDVYVVDNVGDVVVENLDEGIDHVRSGITYTLGAHLEILVLAGTASIDGTGNGLDNKITGNIARNILTGREGNDTLDGREDADTLIGGAGNDDYYVDHTGDVVTELAGGGTDIVRSTVSHTLGANVENLTLTGLNINGTGNSLDNIITGSGGSNTLIAGDGHDVLDGGGAGLDTLIGGRGDDTYFVHAPGVVVTEQAGQGRDVVITSATYTLSVHVEELRLTGTVAINATGNASDNVLTGNAAANALDGAGGADAMSGGQGADNYYVDNSGDTVIEGLNEGIDTVRSAVTFTLGANVENLIFTGSAAADGTGNALHNVLTGNSARNTLTGGDGNDSMDGLGDADRMVGGRGSDVYVVDNVGDVVVENLDEGIDHVRSGITYTLGAHLEILVLAGTASIDGTGNGLDNKITGNIARNILTGREGNDTLDGREGADTMIGGAGNDDYYVDNPGDVVTELSGGGTDTVRSAIDYTLGANVENLILTGDRAQVGTGNALANVIVGNALANVLYGAGGNDTLRGGGGDDGYVVEDVGDVVTEQAGEGHDFVQSFVTFTLGANVEDLVLIGNLAINGTGNGLDNALGGNSAANVLTGGAGNDRYEVGAGDSVVELAGGGIDTVDSRESYVLGANVENLTLRGTADVNASGNSLANVITGNLGANRLEGGGGIDTLAGLEGNDTYYVDADDVVVENANEGIDLVRARADYVLPANVENLALEIASAARNATGNALANVITGNTASNILDGGGGVDTMIGGLGNDTYIVDDADFANAPTVLDLHGEPGVYLVPGHLQFTPYDGAFTVTAQDYTGDGLADTLHLAYLDDVGYSGNWLYLDITTRALGQNLAPGFYDHAQRAAFAELGHPGLDFYGNGTGANQVAGNFTINEAVFDYSGSTIDVVRFSVDFEFRAEIFSSPVFGTFNYNYSGGVVIPESVVELPNQGTDTVYASVDYVLPENVEYLTLTGSDPISGGGNSSAVNLITGNIAANRLTGGAGRDIFDFKPGSVAPDTITDFTIGNDILGLSEVLPGLRGNEPVVLANFVRLLDAGAGGTAVQVNGDGVGSDFTTVVYLENVAWQANLLSQMISQTSIYLG